MRRNCLPTECILWYVRVATSHVRMSSLIFSPPCPRPAVLPGSTPAGSGGWGGSSCLMTSLHSRPEFFFYLRQMHLQIIIVRGEMFSMFCFYFQQLVSVQIAFTRQIECLLPALFYTDCLGKTVNLGGILIRTILIYKDQTWAHLKI